jgi:TnpA family transposase
LIKALLEKTEKEMYPFTLLQKEPSSFDYYQIRRLLERQKILAPIYDTALRLCKQMKIANENIRYYGNMAMEYKVFNLKRMLENSNLPYVYLLCFAHNRYRIANDILIEALRFHVLGLEKSAEKAVQQQLYDYQLAAHQSLAKVPKILALFQDQAMDEHVFEVVKKIAFDILSPEGFDLVIELIDKTKPDKKELTGQFYELKKRLISLYLRPICFHFRFSSNQENDNLITTRDFLKESFEDKKKRNIPMPLADFTYDFLSKKRQKYILDETGNIQLARYEMALYQALRNKLESGDVFLSDSFNHRNFDEDLLSKKNWKDNKSIIIKQVAVPKMEQDISTILKDWQDKIEPLYKRVNKRMENGENPSVQIDEKNKDGTVKWHLIYTETSNPLNHQIYQQFAPIDIAEMLQIVDKHTGFLNAFTHFLGTNVNRKTDKDQLIACLVAYGTNYGIGKMASISDMSYQSLITTAKSLIYLETLKEANRKIINKTATLSMYQHYHLDTNTVHSSSDGQKYYTQIPTINARYSSKYFGLAKGISSLTNVANNISVNADLVGANEHESHYVFDLIYNNNTDVQTNIHSTDSHGINQVNFAILDMFGYQFAPRYKQISSKSKSIYSFQHPNKYEGFVLKPKRKLNTELIKDEWDNFQRILASLAMKTTTQSTIIKKLSSHKRNNRTRKAIVEYNHIVETYHKLRYIDAPDFQKQVQTALNRGEHINKLRKHLFHANGGKFKVHTVMEQKIWSESNRLLTNAMIYYNTWLLSELLAYHEELDNVLEVDLIKKVSPIAWQHIHIHGRYRFKIGQVVLDVRAMVKKVKF